MNTPNQSARKEKASSPASSLSLPTPPDSAEELSTSLSRSLSSSAHSLSQPAQRAFDIFKSIKQGYGPDSSWLKLRLEPGDYSLLEEKLKVEGLWGFVDDKIRFDYDPQTRVLVFRMPSGIHEIFTAQVIEEINNQLKCLRMDTSRPDVATLAKSIQWCASTDIFMLGDFDQAKHSPDSSFRHIGAKFPSLIIETSFSQKKKDLPRLADDYIIDSDGNIKMMIGLDIEYRNSKKATVSVWKYEEGIEEDGVPYICAKKLVDNQSFQNDDSSSIIDGALVIPLSIFILDETPLNTEISISYTTLKSFLEEAKNSEQKIKTSGSWKLQPQGIRRKKRQITPEELLKDDDEAQFVAREEEAERKANMEDGIWTPKKTRR